MALRMNLLPLLVHGRTDIPNLYRNVSRWRSYSSPAPLKEKARSTHVSILWWLLADFNRDGKDDLIACTNTFDPKTRSYWSFQNTTSHAPFNDSDSFAPALEWTWAEPTTPDVAVRRRMAMESWLLLSLMKTSRWFRFIATRLSMELLDYSAFEGPGWPESTNNYPQKFAPLPI